MSNFSDFIGGGGGGGLPVNIVLGYSQTWVPPVDGNICIHVVGGGGAGLGSTGSNSGAGAGGYSKKNSLAVTTSGSFTVVIGAGGTGNNGGTGGNGGTSSVAGTGLSAPLRAFGGTGASEVDATGAGGPADGGDVNNTGGAGGTYGGGAVGITGTGNSGGTNNGLLYGGSCDVLGPESLIGYGNICGGKGGRAYWVNTNSATNHGLKNTIIETQGGFLSGGGLAYIDGSGIGTRLLGGDGGIGGGGGGANNDYSASYARGGDGGSGIVIIQYLPA